MADYCKKREAYLVCQHAKEHEYEYGVCFKSCRGYENSHCIPVDFIKEEEFKI